MGISSLLLATLVTAHAAGTHAGLRSAELTDFQTPRHQSARLGYTMDFEGGIARVYVGPSAEAAREWYDEHMLFVARSEPTAVEGLGDAAVGSEDSMVLFIDSNVAVLVQVKDGALEAAQRLHQAIERTEIPWPQPPKLVRSNGTFTVQRPDATHIAWVGGELARTSPTPSFTHAPRRLVVWDEWGRAAVQDFDKAGAPVATPPLRPSPLDASQSARP